MADKSPLRISPELFRWARDSAGLPLELAARRIGVKPERLQEWEGVEAQPTARQLERAADAYKRPVASFFLPVPPNEPALPIDFRAPAVANQPLSTVTRLAIRRARWLKGVYSDFSEAENVNTIPRLDTNQPEEIARLMRDWLAAPAAQVRGKQPSDALKIWRHALEEAGLLVFQFSMPINEAHAFSLVDGVPAIVLNSHDAYARRTFSTLHEVAHLILRQPGLCNPSESVQAKAPPEIEGRCNAAAGLALVPDDELANHPVVLRLQRRGDVGASLEPLARAFAVSRQVIVTRLLHLEVINLPTFRRTMDVLQMEFDEQQKQKKKRKVIVKPSTKAVSQLGNKFVADAVAAYERGRITDSDLSEYLGVRLQHLDRIQELVGVE